MESETMYIIVDPDDKWICDPAEDEQSAWIKAVGVLDRIDHFTRAGYRCIPVTVTPHE